MAHQQLYRLHLVKPIPERGPVHLGPFDTLAGVRKYELGGPAPDDKTSGRKSVA